MLRLQQLFTHSPSFSIAEKLYTEAFPLNERRSLEDWRKLADEEGAFQIFEILSDGRFSGFVSCWQMGNFIYIEHFAILAALRCHGLGKEAVELLKKTYSPLPLVLEAEPPECALAQRRIAFYERSGFSLSQRHYLQPPYHPGTPWFPLLLLCTDARFLEEQFEAVRNNIYSSVYHQKAPFPKEEKGGVLSEKI